MDFYVHIGDCHFLLCQHTNTKDIAGQSAKVEQQYEIIETYSRFFSPGIRTEKYTYNIKDKLGEHGTSNFSNKLAFLSQHKKKETARKKERVSYKDSKCENTLTRTCSKRSLNGSPRYRRRPNSLNSLTMKNEGVNTSVRSLNKMSYPKLEGMMRTSDTEEYSDVKTEDEEAQPMMVKPTGLKPAIKPAGGLWKKVGRQLLPCAILIFTNELFVLIL